MENWYLSQYFEGVAVKKLSLVEANPAISHQHELNGVKELKQILWEVGDQKRSFDAHFLYLNDFDEEAVSDEWKVTWYDARAKSAERTGRSEYRLYFPTTSVSQCADEGDLLIIGKLPNGKLLVIIAEKESTIASQLQWLFWISNDSHPGFSVRSEMETWQVRIEFASRTILETIGFEVETKDETFLDDIFSRFWKENFPSTKEFSNYARSTLPNITAQDDPDMTLMAWVEREEVLFRTLERYLLADRLAKWFMGDGGVADVDWFIGFSLHVQNRRKSRAGASLENHLEYLFKGRSIRHSRTEITENRSKPDFLFPGIEEYKDLSYPINKLTMLWAKTSCKDRWRQVLPEAKRIKEKHLITLQTAISESQTKEMQSEGLQLILPKKLHETYTPSQQSWLMDLNGFMELVKSRDVR